MASTALTDPARPATTTVTATDGSGRKVPTPIAGEHPLTLYLDQCDHELSTRINITMIGRSQGRHGLLFTARERFIHAPPTR